MQLSTNFFLQKYGVKSKLPDRTTISRTVLTDVYNSMKDYVCLYITNSNSKYGAITLDLWTDSYRRLSYINFCYFFIDNSFNLVKVTLAVQNITSRHTGDAILSEIENIIENFNLQDKKIYLVSDAGSNVLRAARLGNFEKH